MSRRPATLAMLAILSLPVPVAAQELRPLMEYLNLPQERQSLSYLGERCAGLYQGIWDYGGANLPQDVQETTKLSITVLMRWAAMQRLQKQYERTRKLPDAQALSRQVMKDVLEIGNRYVERIRRNYATTGEAWGSDPLVQSDMIVCGALAEKVNNANPSLQ